MTAKGIAERLVVRYGREDAKRAVLGRMYRHHALTVEGIGTPRFLRAAARFTVWGAVSMAILRTEDESYAR